MESAVQVVQRWIVAALRKRSFFSLVEPNTAIAELLVLFNDKPSPNARVPAPACSQPSTNLRCVRFRPIIMRSASVYEGPCSTISRSGWSNCGGSGRPRCISLPRCCFKQLDGILNYCRTSLAQVAHEQILDLTALDWAVSHFVNQFLARNKGSFGERTTPPILTKRGTRMTEKLFRDCYWHPALPAAGLHAHPHQGRHWSVTNALRVFEKRGGTGTAQTGELIKYMP